MERTDHRGRAEVAKTATKPSSLHKHSLDSCTSDMSLADLPSAGEVHNVSARDTLCVCVCRVAVCE